MEALHLAVSVPARVGKAPDGLDRAEDKDAGGKVALHLWIIWPHVKTWSLAVNGSSHHFHRLVDLPR